MRWILLLITCVGFLGCATPPDEIEPVHVDADPFRSYDCTEIESKMV